MKMVPVAAASIQAFRMPPQIDLPAAENSAPAAPTAAASVGVKMPNRFRR